jgi:hypothetical protein
MIPSKPAPPKPNNPAHLLQQFSQKKDRMVLEQILKHRSSQVHPVPKTSFTSSSLNKSSRKLGKIYTVEDEEFEVDVSDRTLMSAKGAAVRRDPPVVITVKQNGVRYEISEYKRGCGICKSVKKGVAAVEERQPIKTLIRKEARGNEQVKYATSGHTHEG